MRPPGCRAFASFALFFLSFETAGLQGVRVVLDGQGSDELFAGYPRHQLVALTDWLRRGSLRQVLRELTWLARRDPGFFRDFWRLRIVPRLAGLMRLERND